MEYDFLQTSVKPIIKLRHKFFKVENQEHNDRILVMIPGFLDNIDSRMPLVEAFQQISNVIMYEPRGYGESSAPRRRRKYKVKHFVEDFAKLVAHYKLKDGEYYVWGSCVGSAIAYQYYLDNDGPKPSAIIAASPDAKFKTQWWFDIVNILPYPLVWLVYKLVKFVLKRYLGKKNPSDVKNIDYSVDRFNKLDLYVQMRILVELIHRYDIRGRENELDIPILVLSPKKDWFVEPENSKKMAEYHLKSKFICLGDAHRMIVDTEEAIAQFTTEFISSLRQTTI
ncbi:MAG: alpha/beta fold hydrolase [Candidatus Heimdallarchaeaceae archaeon]